MPKDLLDTILRDLDRAFFIQLSRIRLSLFPPSHSPGSRKPSLEAQESRLLGAQDTDEDDI